MLGPGPCRAAKQAASTLSKLPPHTLEAGGLDPATQSAANQQAYLGSLAERFLPVDLSLKVGRGRYCSPRQVTCTYFEPCNAASNVCQASHPPQVKPSFARLLDIL